MKSFRKIVSVLIAFVCIVVAGHTNTYAASMDEKNEEIDSLMEMRASLICSGDYDSVKLIDEKLESLGIEKKTQSEVNNLFFMGKLDIFKGKMNTLIDIPSGMSNVQWFSNTEEYTYKGVTYVIQTLTAQPKNQSSNLMILGSRTISLKKKWKMGAVNALSTLAWDGASSISGTSLAVTIYDTAKAFVSGISPETEISSANIAYSYSYAGTATFKYIKKKGQPDSSQSLAYISTKGMASIGYQYPSLVLANNRAFPNVVQGRRSVSVTPSGYNSNLNAVRAYRGESGVRRACVSNFTITGPESKIVSQIYPVFPSFPMQIN